MHEVLVNRLGGLSLPRKSVVRLTDRPDMTLDVYRGRKTTIQQQQYPETLVLLYCCSSVVVNDVEFFCLRFLKTITARVTEDPRYNDTVCYHRFCC